VNWEAIGAVGEILGAAAVVLSLVYLAGQIRTQNRESRISAMHDMSVGFRDAVAKFSTEDMSKLLVRANVNFDDLTDDEALRLVVTFGGLFRAWEEAFVQHEEGRLDQRGWDAMNRYYLLALSSGGAQRAWALRKDYLDPEFVTFVDQLTLAEYKFR
jgi:hypothetical protein